MNSKKTNENTLRIEDLFQKAFNNNKSASPNLSDIKFNQEELDILSKEISEEKASQKNNEDINQINVNLSNEEINTLLNEINNNNNLKKPDQMFLNKKRKKKFISVNNQKEKQNFIYYKLKKEKIEENNNNSRNKVSLLSYNILNQIFMKKMNRPDLNIDDRMNKIKQEILELNPDIFCLQEADIYVYKKYLLKKDMEQYNILYGINCGSSFINIIAYKKNKSELKSFKNFSLLFLGKSAGNRGIMTVDLELINNDINNNNKEKDNNNLNIKENELNKNITIYNVHFPWKYENDRILLLNILFQHIKENYSIDENKSIFILGDFNSEPPSRTIKLFYYNKIKHDKRNFYIKKLKNKKKSFDLQTLELSEFIYNHFKFQSAYQCYSKEKMIKGDIMRHPLFTSRTKFYKRTIDYIFFSKNAKINKILKLPKYYNVDKEKFLPSKEYPSDHLKLFAEFYL